MSPADEFDCGCPGATTKWRRNTPPTQASGPINGSTANDDMIPALSARSWTNNSAGLTAPRPAHVHDPSSGVQETNPETARPIHLLRSPSFNPPPFDEDEPPPPLMSPPPTYENAVTGDSTHALADYFARLADEMGDEDDQEDRGRVDVPLTPGGRVHRSMDAARAWLPLDAAAAR
jgi:arrestin-related trafficking adapter 3/6